MRKNNLRRGIAVLLMLMMLFSDLQIPDFAANLTYAESENEISTSQSADSSVTEPKETQADTAEPQAEIASEAVTVSGDDSTTAASTEAAATATPAPAAEATAEAGENTTISEPTVEATEDTSTPEATAEAGENDSTPEVRAEPTAEAATEPTEVCNTPSTEEATVEPSEEPTLEPTVEPTPEPVELVLGDLQASALKINLGESAAWSFDCAGADSVSYTISNSNGETVASGALEESFSFSFTPNTADIYTIRVCASNATQNGESSALLCVKDGELNFSAATAQRYAVADDTAICYELSVSGGIAPYTLSFIVKHGGKSVNEQTITLGTAGAQSFSYMPTAYGEHSVEMSVRDAYGETKAETASMPVAVRESESESTWKKSVQNVPLTGDWRKDVVAIAQSQLGYMESERDFIIREDGTRQGYTRYGAWYGAAYEEWCAMFVSFCLNYAGISESDIPQEAGCERWLKTFKSLKAYAERDEYQPQPGDIVFFNNDSHADADHVGIVESVSETQINTIEGNSGKRVQRKSYALSDVRIMGYVSMEKLMECAGVLEQFQPTPEPTAEATAEPTIEPSEEPTEEPTIEPTVEPTKVAESFDFTVEVSVSPAEAQLGETITFTAETIGNAPENLNWQWQYSTDGQIWKDVEGANDSVYSIDADEDVFLRYYRAMATLPGADDGVMLLSEGAEDDAAEAGEADSAEAEEDAAESDGGDSADADPETEDNEELVVPQQEEFISEPVKVSQRSTVSAVYWNPDDEGKVDGNGFMIIKPGNDENNGLSADAPVQTWDRVIEVANTWGTTNVVYMWDYNLPNSGAFYFAPETHMTLTNYVVEGNSEASHGGSLFTMTGGAMLELSNMTVYSGAAAIYMDGEDELVLGTNLSIYGNIQLVFPTTNIFPIKEIQAENGVNSGKYLVSFDANTAVEPVAIALGNQLSKLALADSMTGWELIVKDDGNTYARRELPYQYIYIDGVDGDDANKGNETTCPVKTFKRAHDLMAQYPNVSIIYVMNTVTISEPGEYKLSDTGSSNPKVYRYSSCTNALFCIEAAASDAEGEEDTETSENAESDEEILLNFYIHGNSGSSTIPMIKVTGGTVTLGSGMTMDYYSGNAVYQTGGTVNIKGATIYYNNSAHVINNMSGEVNLYSGALTSNSNGNYSYAVFNISGKAKFECASTVKLKTRVIVNAGGELTTSGVDFNWSNYYSYYYSYLINHGTVTMNGGSAYYFYNTGIATISGGSVTYLYNGYDDSSYGTGILTVDGGSITNCNAYADSNITVESGTITTLTDQQSGAIVTVNGGQVTKATLLTGILYANGGTISTSSSNKVTSTGKVYIDGSTIYYLEFNGTILDMKSGSVTYALYANKGTMTMSGGTISGSTATSGILYDYIPTTVTGGTIKKAYLYTGCDFYANGGSQTALYFQNNNAKLHINGVAQVTEVIYNVATPAEGAYISLSAKPAKTIKLTLGTAMADGRVMVKPEEPLENAGDWLKSFQLTADASNYSLYFALKNEGNDIVLRYQGIFISGSKGDDDANDGLTKEAPVRTFAHAVERLKEEVTADSTFKKFIIVLDTVTLEADDSICPTISGVAMIPYESIITGIIVPEGMTLNTKNVTLNNINYTSQLIHVKGGKLYLNAGTAMNVTSGTAIIAEGEEPYVYVDSASTISSSSYGVYLKTGTIDMKGTITSSKKATTYSYSQGCFGLKVETAVANVSGTITNLSGYGLELVEDTGAVANVTGTISTCNGKGIQANSGTTVNITSAAINNNGYAIVGENGGGICLESGAACVINGATISGNRCGKSGGGIYVASGASCSFSSTIAVTYNYAKVSGGGIYLNGGTTDSYSFGSNLTVKYNGRYAKGSTASAGYGYTTYGGGIYIDSNAPKCSFNDSVIANNYAQNAGGGIYYSCSSKELTLKNVNLNSNSQVGTDTAKTNGGGALYIDAGNVNYDNCTTSGCSASSGNGAAISVAKNGSMTHLNGVVTGTVRTAGEYVLKADGDNIAITGIVTQTNGGKPMRLIGEAVTFDGTINVQVTNVFLTIIIIDGNEKAVATKDKFKIIGIKNENLSEENFVVERDYDLYGGEGIDVYWDPSEVGDKTSDTNGGGSPYGAVATWERAMELLSEKKPGALVYMCSAYKTSDSDVQMLSGEPTLVFDGQVTNKSTGKTVNAVLYRSLAGNADNTLLDGTMFDVSENITFKNLTIYGGVSTDVSSSELLTEPAIKVSGEHLLTLDEYAIVTKATQSIQALSALDGTIMIHENAEVSSCYMAGKCKHLNMDGGLIKSCTYGLVVTGETVGDKCAAVITGGTFNGNSYYGLYAKSFDIDNSESGKDIIFQSSSRSTSYNYCGIYCSDLPASTKCKVIGAQFKSNGTGISITGLSPGNSYSVSYASYVRSVGSGYSLTIEDCTFTGNYYGIYTVAYCGSGTGGSVTEYMKLSNCTFTSNTSYDIYAGAYYSQQNSAAGITADSCSFKSGSVIFLYNNVSLTLKGDTLCTDQITQSAANSTYSKYGNLDVCGNTILRPASSKYAIYSNNYFASTNIVVRENAVIDLSNTTYHGVYLTNAAKCQISENAQITSNTRRSSQYGVYIYRSAYNYAPALEMNGGSITNCGSGVYVGQSGTYSYEATAYVTLDIANAEISQNVYGIYLYNYRDCYTVTVNLDATEMDENSYGIYFSHSNYYSNKDSKVIVSLKNGTSICNSTYYGICANGGTSTYYQYRYYTLNMDSTSKICNNAQGGIYLNYNAYYLWKGTISGEISGNGTVGKTSYGGVFFDGYVYGLTFDGVVIKDNYSSTNGGGMCLNDIRYYSNGSGTRIVLKNCTFENNRAATNAGALYIYPYNTKFEDTIYNCTFTDNTAGSNGGAVYIYSGKNVTFEGCTFSGNQATYGGAIYSGGTLYITGNTMRGNTSTSDNDLSNGIYCAESYYTYINGGRVCIYDNVYLSSVSYPLKLVSALRSRSSINVTMNFTGTKKFKAGSVVVSPYSSNVYVPQNLKYFNASQEGYVLTKTEKEIVLKRAIFVSGNGDDDNEGASPANPFKTVERAFEAAKEDPNSSIFICGEVPVSGIWDNGSSTYSILRYTGFAVAGKNNYPAYTGNLFSIAMGKSLQIESGIYNISAQRADTETVKATGALFDVAKGASLTFGKNSTVTLDGNTRKTGSGGAIANRGTVNINTPLTVTCMYAQNGGVIYNAGTVNQNAALTVDDTKSYNGGVIYNDVDAEYYMNANLTVSEERVYRKGSTVYQAGLFQLKDGVTIQTSGTRLDDFYLTNDQPITLEGDFTISNTTLSVDIGDPRDGRIYVQYLDEGTKDPDTEKARYSLSKRIQLAYLLRHRLIDEELDLVLELPQIVYVNENFDGTKPDVAGIDEDSRGKYADYPFTSIREAYEYLQTKDGGLIYLVEPVTVTADMSVGINAYTDAEGTITIAGDGGTNIKRYSKPDEEHNKNGLFTHESNTSMLFNIKDGATLTLDQMMVNGHSEAVEVASEDRLYTIAPAVVATEPMIVVNEGGTLNLKDAMLDFAENSTAGRASLVYNNGTMVIKESANSVDLNGTVMLAEGKVIDVEGASSAAANIDVLLEDKPYTGRVVARYTFYPNDSQYENYTMEEEVLVDFKLVVKTMEKTVILQQRGAAYVDGVNGSDENDGLTPETPIKTMKQAYENLTTDGGKIYIVNTVSIDQNMSLLRDQYLDDEERVETENEVRIYRYAQPYVHANVTGFEVASFQGALFEIEEDASLIVENIEIDGFKDDLTTENINTANAPAVEANAAMFQVYGTLTINEDAQILDNNNVSTKNYGGAIRVYSSGTLELNDECLISGHSAEKGSGIYLGGKMTMENSPEIGADLIVYMEKDCYIYVKKALNLASNLKVDFATAEYTSNRVIAKYAAKLTPDNTIFKPCQEDAMTAGLLTVEVKKQDVMLRATYDIFWKVKNVYDTNMPKTTFHNDEVKATFEPCENYIPPDTLEITVKKLDGTEIELTQDEDYSYDPETGVLTLHEEETIGHITIVGEAIPNYTRVADVYLYAVDDPVRLSDGQSITATIDMTGSEEAGGLGINKLLLKKRTLTVQSITSNMSGMNVVDIVDVEGVKKTAGYETANSTFAVGAQLLNGSSEPLNNSSEKALHGKNSFAFGTDAFADDVYNGVKLNLTLHNANAITTADTEENAPVVTVVLTSAQKDKLTLNIHIVRVPSSINATVPLVIVMKTNIDGGAYAFQDADNYRITNNSSMRVSLTEAKADSADENVLKAAGENDDLDNMVDSYKITLRQDIANKDIAAGESYNPIHSITFSRLSFVTRLNTETEQYGVKAASITYKLEIPKDDPANP